MRVLLVSTEGELARLRQATLEAQGIDCTLTLSVADAHEHITRERFDAMAVCHTISEPSMEELDKQFRKHNPNAGVVLIQKTAAQPKKDHPDVVVVGVEGPEALRDALEQAYAAHS